MPNAGGWSDEEFDRLLGRLLQTGVVISASFVAVGLAIYLARHGHEQPRLTRFAGEPEQLRTIAGILRSLTAVQGRGLLQFGILALIATPVARVAFSLFAFARQKDRTYVVITLVVLTVLVLSLTGVL